MLTINIHNSKSKIECTLEELELLRKQFRLRVPGAFFSNAFRNRTWDGYSYYVTDRGYTFTGMVPKICQFMTKENWEYELIDHRKGFRALDIPQKVGKLELRGYQFDSTKSVLINEFEGIHFPRGILNEATNAGKNLIAAALFKAYPEDKRLIFIINRKHIYEQAKKEIAELIGREEVGWIGSEGIKWNRFMICMAGTITSRIHSLKPQLSRMDIVMVDECHYASSPTFKEILNSLENSFVRIGLSGSPFKHKDKNKNERILAFFGPELHATTNDQLIKLGFSTKPIVVISKGNTKVKCPKDYQQELDRGLIHSKERNGVVLRRVKHHVKKKRIPILVVAKFHNHTELLYRKISKAFPELRVDFIHVKVRDRMAKLKRFKEGKIDILVSSKLIKEGQNLPLIKALVVAAGGDSVIDVLQLVGRALRKHKSKNRVWIDDFMDKGAYLARHSKHRIKVYKGEKFTIKDKSL